MSDATDSVDSILFTGLVYLIHFTYLLCEHQFLRVSFLLYLYLPKDRSSMSTFSKTLLIKSRAVPCLKTSDWLPTNKELLELMVLVFVIPRSSANEKFLPCFLLLKSERRLYVKAFKARPNRICLHQHASNFCHWQHVWRDVTRHFQRC